MSDELGTVRRTNAVPSCRLLRELNMDRASAIRELRGLRTQQEFASELGVYRQAVAALEQGRAPSMKTARRLVELGLDISHVLPVAGAASGRKVAS